MPSRNGTGKNSTAATTKKQQVSDIEVALKWTGIPDRSVFEMQVAQNGGDPDGPWTEELLDLLAEQSGQSQLATAEQPPAPIEGTDDEDEWEDEPTEGDRYFSAHVDDLKRSLATARQVSSGVLAESIEREESLGSAAGALRAIVHVTAENEEYAAVRERLHHAQGDDREAEVARVMGEYAPASNSAGQHQKATEARARKSSQAARQRQASVKRRSQLLDRAIETIVNPANKK